MSSTDRRIVEMQFDNQQFEKGIATSTKSLDGLEKSLNLKDSTKGLTAVERAAEVVSRKFSVMGIAGITAIQNITNSALNAAKRLVSSLTIDPIKSGMQEYELTMNSIQVLMSGTGESLDRVKDKLGELNTYSDQTIYSFSDMTSNIGKFTNAGVSLDDSVVAMKGIANWAALSGASANDAARAMYNLGQAMGQGSVRLIDWKSVENANMGTQRVKKELIAAAQTAGYLDAAGKTTSKALKAGVEVTAQNMQYTLDEMWLTNDVLMSVLKKFTDTNTDLGKEAIEAATQVKTLSQLLGVLRESAQSGWAQSWTSIFGDFDQAKALFTEMNDVFGGIISAAAEARNKLLLDWQKLGGRDSLLQSIRNIWNTIGTIATAIGNAFEAIFPPLTASRLADMTKSFEAFTKSALDWLLNPVNGVSRFSKITKVFKGLFSIFKIGQKVLSAIGKAIGNVFKPLLPGAVDGLLDFFTNLGDSITKFADDLDLSDLTDKLTIWINDLKTWLTPAWNWLKQAAIDIGDAVKDFFGVGKKPVPEGEKTGWQKLLSTLKEWYNSVVAFFTPAWNWLKQAAIDIWATIKDFFGIGKDPLPEGEQTGWQKLLTTFTWWYNDVVAFFTPAWNWLKQAAIDIGDAIKDFFGVGKDPLPEGEQTGWQKLLTTFTGWYNDVVAFFTPAWNWLKQAAIDIWAAIKDFFGIETSTGPGGSGGSPKKQTKYEQLLSTLKEWYDSVVAFFTPAWSWLKQAAIDIGDAIKDFFGIGKDPLPEGEQTGWQKLLTTFTGWYNDVVAFFTPAWNWLVENSSKTWDSIKEFFGIGQEPLPEGEQTGWQKLWTIFKGWYDELVIWFAPALAWIKQAATDIKEAFTGLFSGTGETEEGGEKKSVVTQVTELLGNPKDINLFLDDFVGIVRSAWTGFKEKIAAIISSAEDVRSSGVKPGIFDGLLLFLKDLGTWFSQNWGWLALIGAGAVILKVITTINNIAKLGSVIVKLKSKVPTGSVIDSIGGSILKIAGAIVLIVASLYALTTMDQDKLGQAELVIGGVITVLGTLSILGTKIMTVPAGMVAGNLGVSMLGIAGSVVLIIIAIQKMMAFIDSIKSARDLQLLAESITAIGLVVLALTGVLKSLNGVSFGGGTLKLGGLIPFAISVYILVQALMPVAGMSKDSIERMKEVLLAIDIALVALTGLSRYSVPGTAFQTFVGMVGIAGLVWVIGETLTKIKPVNTKSIDSTLGGIKGLLLAFGIYTALVGRISIQGLGIALLGILGIIAVVMLVVSAFSLLSQDSGFQQFVNRGAASIGEMIGTFLGSMKAAEVTAFNDGLTKFKEITVNPADVQNAIDIAKLLQDFADALPDKTFGQTLLDTLLGTPMGDLKKNILNFAGMVNELGQSLNTIRVPSALEGTIKSVVAGLGVITTFISGLDSETKTIGEAAAKLVAADPWSSKLGRFTQILDAFEDLAKRLGTFTTNTMGLDVSKVTAAIDAMVRVKDVINTLSGDDSSGNAWDEQADQLKDVIWRIGYLGDQLKVFKTGSEGLDLTAVSAFITTVSDLATAIGGLPSTVSAEVITELISMVGQLSTTLSTDLVGSVATGIQSGTDSVLEKVKKLASRAHSVLKSWYNAFYNVGYFIGAGVAKGIRSSIDDVVRAARELANAAEQAAKTGLGEASPSKVFAGIGMFIDQGLANGIKKYTYLATSAMATLANTTENTFNTALNIHSPSKAMVHSGKNLMAGLADGIKDNRQLVVDAVQSVADDIKKVDLSLGSPGRGGGSGGSPQTSSWWWKTPEKGVAPRYGIGAGALAAARLDGKVPVTNVPVTNGKGSKGSKVITTPKLTSYMGTVGLGLSQAQQMASVGNQIDQLGKAIANMKVVMDSGALVGQISAKMDRVLGIAATYAGRGG